MTARDISQRDGVNDEPVIARTRREFASRKRLFRAIRALDDLDLPFTIDATKRVYILTVIIADEGERELTI